MAERGGDNIREEHQIERFYHVIEGPETDALLGNSTVNDAVIEMLSADFVSAKVDVPAENGRVLAYLSAHAEVYRQEFHDNRIKMFGAMPRHLVRHIQEPDVLISENGKADRETGRQGDKETEAMDD